MAQITVIIPVLNGMPYLRETLASIATQTYRDFEVVLWDNGSTDGTVEEAQQWIPSRLPGRVVTGDPLPLHLCLARMVNEATSPFVARMDADDVCLPHRLEKEMDYLQKNPDVSLVGCQIECIDPQGNQLPREHWAQFPLEHRDIVTRLLFSNAICHPCILFRTESVRGCGNYATPAPVEDLDLYLRLTQKARVANLPSVEVHYRRHPSSICAVAREGDHLGNQMIATHARHAQALHGISSQTYLQLRNKAHPISILPLFKSAIYRSNGKLSAALILLRTPEFLFVGRCLTGSRDYISKACFKIIEMFALTPSPIKSEVPGI